MAINERLIHTAADAAAAGSGNQEEGLILHLDANDVDSYDGDGSVWYDITNHEYTPATNVSEHFNTVTYTGNNSSNSITGVGFAPDLVWIKNRTNANSHNLIDSVRGATEVIYSNLVNDEDTRSNSLTSFDSDGFSLGNYVGVNGNYNYVAWCFKAGGAAVSNTDGTVTSQVSANNDLGFSIVKYTGNGSSSEQTVGHGLGVKPEMVIIKDLDNDRDWYVYTDIIDGSMDVLYLNKTDAKVNSSRTSPTSSVYKIAGTTTLNKSNQNFISYCFASKRGVSKVGSFVGTGTSGKKIYTGFEPAFIMTKRSSSAGASWAIIDNKRSTDSNKNDYLSANTSNTEATSSSGITFNRDGFTFNGSSFNTSGATHIYYAVAKNTNETSLIPDTDLELHLDAASFPQKGESGYSNTPTTWTALTGNNGTISGATFDSELGNYLNFDGSGDIVTSAGNISTTDRDFTVEFWTRPDSTSTSQNFFEVEDTSGNRKISMVVNTGSKFRCYIYRAADFNGSNNVTSVTSFTTGRWYHIAVVFEQGVSAKIYVDGELDVTSTTNVTDDRHQTYGDTKLGDGAFGDLDGAIGQYRFYSSALSADEVMQNFNFTKNDYPNGNDLTLYNSPTFEPTSPNYLRFDSANDEARLSSVNIPIDGGFTFSVYIRRHTSVSGYHQMLRLTGTGYTSYLFLIAGQNNTQYFSANSGTGNSLSTYGDGRTWTNNQWIHVLYTKENGNGSSNRGELYINGTSIKTATNLSNNTDITNIYINRDASFPTTRNAQCDVGYMKLYDKSFTDDEALAEFNATKDDYGL